MCRVLFEAHNKKGRNIMIIISIVKLVNNDRCYVLIGPVYCEFVIDRYM